MAETAEVVSDLCIARSSCGGQVLDGLGAVPVPSRRVLCDGAQAGHAHLAGGSALQDQYWA